MNLTISINITLLMLHNLKHHCQQKKVPYKIASCYLGFLTEQIKRYYLQRGYQQTAVQSSLKRGTYFLQKGEQQVEITQILTTDPLVALFQVKCEKNELADLEAKLKSIGIPPKYIGFSH